MLNSYNPANWYWSVSGNTSQVWSSASLSYVFLTDAAYLNWTALGFTASKIDSTLSLLGIMQDQVLPVIFIKGVDITSTGTNALSAHYSTTPSAQQSIVALSTGIAAGKPVPGGGSTFNYQDSNGLPHEFTATAFLNFAEAVENFIYNTGQAVAARVFGNNVPMPGNNLTIP